MKANKNYPIWINCNGKRYAMALAVVNYIQDNRPEIIAISLEQRVNGIWSIVEDKKYMSEVVSYIKRQVKL